MTSVDSRIVTMKFDNTQFQTGVSQTISSMDKLKSALNLTGIGKGISGIGGMFSGLFSKIGLKNPFTGLMTGVQKFGGLFTSVMGKIGLKNPFATATDGVSELSRTTQQFNTTGIAAMEGGITHISSTWIAMASVAISALATVTSHAVTAAGSWIKGFTFGPVIDGLNEYQTNLKAIQTIQANTDRPLPEINGALQQLNAYSDQTIYNFGEMARNIGTFTAAGVELHTAVSSIKGIANLAALSGSSSEQAATAMYQLSQAIAAGRVGLMDWNSVVNAGMGGKKLQNALAQTAIAMGDMSKNEVKMVGPMEKLTIKGQSFRESIMAQPGKESWLSSDILVNTLKTMDGRFSRAALSQEELKNGTLRYKNAAQVTAQIEKNRNELAKEGVKFSDEQFKALMKMSDMAFNSAQKVKTLGQVFDIAKETMGSGWSATFQNIFGNLNEAKKLFTGMSNGLNDIIKQNSQARNNTLAKWKSLGGRDTLIEGLNNAWQAFYKTMQAIGGAFRDIFPRKTPQELVSMTQAFADFTKKLIPSKQTLEGLKDTFRGLFAVVDIVWQVIKGFGSAIGDVFSAIGSGSGGFLSFTGSIGDMLVALDNAIKKGGLLKGFFTGLGAVLSAPIKLIQKLGEVFSNLFSGFEGKGDMMSSTIGKMAQRLSPLETIGAKIKDVFSKIGDFFADLGPNIGKAILGIGDAVANMFTPETFGHALDLLNTGLLAGIVLMLKRFFSGGLKIDVGQGMFSKVGGALDQLTGTLKSMQQQIKADTMTKIAIAIAILAGSLFVLASIDPKRLTSALIGMGIGFGVLQGSLVVLSKYISFFGGAKLMLISLSLVGLATAILILAAALKIMASMSWSEIAKGLTTLAVTLGLVIGAVMLLGKSNATALRTSVALLAIGIAVNLLAGALKIMATMSWEEIAKGLVALAGALVIIAGATNLMGGPKLVFTAAGIVLVGIAVNILAGAMKVLGGMSWEEIAKGLVAIAGALLIIAGATALMGGPSLVITAAGLLLVAISLNVMAGAMKIMGGMSWEEIAKSMVVLAGGLLILAGGLYLMTGAIVGAAALVIAAGALAILAPVLMALGTMEWESIAKGMVALAGTFVVLGVAGMLLGPVTPIILALSVAILLIGAGFALAGAGAFLLASAFGILVTAASAGTVVLSALFAQIIKSIPKAMGAIGHGIVNMAREIGKGGREFTRAFSSILSGILHAVIKNVPLIAKAFHALIDAGVRAVHKDTGRIIRAGFELMMQFLRAVRKNIGDIVDIVSDIIVKFLNGISRNMHRIAQAGTRVILKFIHEVGNQGPKIVNEGMKAVIKFINGTADAVRRNSGDMRKAGQNLGFALIDGMTGGLATRAHNAYEKAQEIAHNIIGTLAKAFKSLSPSRETMYLGRMVSLGLAVGMDQEAGAVGDSAGRVAHGALDTFRVAMKTASDAARENLDFNPIITPILDLTDLANEANRIGSIVGGQRVTAGVAYQTASDISAEQLAALVDALNDVELSGDASGDTFVQNNYSPKPLDPVTIYRQTRNLVNLARKEAAP